MPDIFDEIAAQPVSRSKRMPMPPKPDIFDELAGMEDEGDIFDQVAGAMPYEKPVPRETSSIVPPTMPDDVPRASLSFRPSGEALTPEMRREEALPRLLDPVREVGRGIKGVARGMAGTVEGMAGAAQWLTEGALGKDLADKAKEWGEYLSPEALGKKSTFRDVAYGGAGSAATFFIPGTGVAKGASAIARISPKLAAWAGSGAAGAMEAATEGGQVYRDMLEKTGDINEAESAATKTFWLNLPLIAITNKIGIFGETGGVLKRGAVSSQVEGFQEAAQEYISSNAKGEKATLGDMLTAYGVGAITGGPMGAITALGQAEAPIPPTEATTPEAAPEAQPMEAAPVERDIFDEVAEATEGEGAPTLEELAAEFYEEPKGEPDMSPRFAYSKDSEKNNLQPLREGGNLNIEGGIKNDSERIQREAKEGDGGVDIEAAESIARSGLRSIPKTDEVEYRGIKSPDKRRAAAAPIREAEAKTLRDWSKQNDLDISGFEAKHEEAKTRGVKGGQENNVYLDAASGRWHKANRLTHSPTYSDLFYRINKHNELFPEAAYRFEGFTDMDGQFMPVFSQQNIQETEEINPKEKERLAAEELEAMGFRAESDFPGLIPATRFVNDELGIVIHDINASNLAYVDGKIVFFDAIIEKQEVSAAEPVLSRKRASEAKPKGTEADSTTLRTELEPTLKRWRNAPPINVVQSTADLPAYLKKYIASQQGDGNIEGLFDPRSESVYLISDNITSTERAQEVLFHEVLGHYGLRGTLGTDIKPLLSNVYLRHQKEANAIADQYGIDVSTIEGKHEAAEEVLAQMAQKGTNQKLIQKVVAIIRKWLKKMGLNLQLSDNDIRNVIAEASRFVEKGKGGPVGGKVGFMAEAYHGTPHKFDKFTLDNIGTGEGAQAYGWGLYFTETKDVAAWYRDKLGIEYVLKDKNGKVVTHPYASWLATIVGMERRQGREINLNDQAVIQSGNMSDMDKFKKMQEVIAIYRDGGKVEDTGHILRVELAPKADEWLDWDKPLSEQSEKVQNILKKLKKLSGLDESALDVEFGDWAEDRVDIQWGQLEGSDIYRMLQAWSQYNKLPNQDRRSGKAKDVSLYLKSIGIPGIKYLDALSRGKEKGTSNFVVFDEELIKIKERVAFSRAPRPEGMAGEVYDDIIKSRETSLEKKKRTIKQAYKGLKTSLVDVSGNVKVALNKLGPEGKKAVMRHIAYGGAHAKALRMTDKITKEVYGNLSEAEHDYLDQYIYAKRNLEIANYKPNFKMPGGRTKAHMQAAIDAIPADALKKVEKRTEVYWKTMDEQLQELKKEGLLTEAQLKGLRAVGRYYSPRVVLDYIDPMTTSYEGGKKITVPDSGIKKLSDEGSTKLIETDSSLLLSQVINRTQSRIFKNRANQALWELAEAQPDNPLVRKAKVMKATGEGKPVYQPAPHGWEKISVMIEGQRKELMMPEEFAGEWIFKDPILLASQRNMIQWLSGTKILKTMATGLNPEFAFTNVPRDIALIWMSTEEYSPSLPKAMAQVGLDISSVFKDAVMRKGAFEDYVNEGGGMEFLTHQGRFAPKIKGHLGQIQNIMGYLGETSEIMTRLALRQRAIKNGATPEQATIIARSYLDFTQGGNLAKAADSALPYLNAGIQATRGIVRAASTNPKVFTAKAAQVAGLATMLYLANRLLNEDAWDEIPDRDKVNNWIITTPYSYHDATGTKRYIYFKIAKDQGQRVFASIFEAVAAKSIGDKVAADQVVMAAKDFIPFSPTNLPPTMEAVIGYAANKDFWFNEDIWRGPKVKPEEEYTRYTPKAFVEAGKATGLSPERLKNSFQQLFTYGNIWTSLVGAGTKVLLDDLDEKGRDMVTEELILKKPFVRKMVRSTDPYYKYGKAMEEAGTEERTERFKTTRDFDNLVDKYLKGSEEKAEVKKFILKQPGIDRRRLVQRLQRHEKLKGIPERRFWVELLQEPPKTRAFIFWGRLKTSNEKERDELEKLSRKVPGFRGKLFNYQLRKLHQGEK